MPQARLHAARLTEQYQPSLPIDGRTTRHPSYRISTVKRKRIEEPGSRPSAVCARHAIADGRPGSCPET